MARQIKRLRIECPHGLFDATLRRPLVNVAPPQPKAALIFNCAEDLVKRTGESFFVRRHIHRFRWIIGETLDLVLKPLG